MLRWVSSGRRNRMTEGLPSQDGAEIGVGGDQGAAFACRVNENLRVRAPPACHNRAR